MKKSSRIPFAFRHLLALTCGIIAMVVIYVTFFSKGGRKSAQDITMVTISIKPSAYHRNASISQNISAHLPMMSISPANQSAPKMPAMQKGKVTFSASVALTSLSKPVIISVVTSHYLVNYQWKSSPSDACPLVNPVDKSIIQLQCEIQSSGASAMTADALWYHLPSIQSAGQVERHHPKQVRAGFSMESNVYYRQQDNADLMKQFEIKMTYEMDSDVVTTYFWDEPSFRKPPKIPFSQKKDAVGYVNRNCGANNGRHEIIKTLANHYKVDAYGCMGSGERVDKIDFFSKQKVRISIDVRAVL